VWHRHRGAAAGGALEQAAGQAQAEPGDLVGDLALAEFGLARVEGMPCCYRIFARASARLHL
jgi:hypothetical protein